MDTLILIMTIWYLLGLIPSLTILIVYLGEITLGDFLHLLSFSVMGPIWPIWMYYSFYKR